jgi:hypothetical protein
MAPSATAAEAQTSIPIHLGKTAAVAKTKPVQATGVLDSHEYIELTPVIGREYPNLNLVALL